MRTQLFSILFIAAMMLLNISEVFAQAGFDGDVNDAPLDGGLGVLAAIGIGYCAKKIKDKKIAKAK